MSPPSILLVTQQLRHVRSGVGTYARVLVRGLAERGIDLTVATWSSECDPEAFPEIGWLPLGCQPRWDPTPGAFWTLGRRAARTIAAADRVFDVVHFLDAREGHACGHLRRAARVGTVHDDYAVHAPASPLDFVGHAADPLRRWIYYRWLARLERRCYPQFDMLLANSDATALSIADRHRVPATNLRTVHLCVDPGAATKAEVMAGQPALFFAGGNFYRKGLDIVVRSLPLVRTRLPSVHLHVAGHDRAARQIQRLARRLGVVEHLTLHGRVPPARVAAMIAGSDVFVMPSRREALGLVYLEAFQASVPVVAGREGGVADLVRDGETGLVADDVRGCARAIFRLANEPTLRLRLAAGGRRILAERTPPQLVAETLAAYGAVAPAVVRHAFPRGEAVTRGHGEPVSSSSSSSRREPIAKAEKVCS